MSTKSTDILVSNVMLSLDSFPIVIHNEMMRETLVSMNNYKLGIACIVDSNKRLLAVITDGDIRRILLTSQKTLPSLFVEDVLDYSSKDFKFVGPDMSLEKAIDIMGKNKLWDLYDSLFNMGNYRTNIKIIFHNKL